MQLKEYQKRTLDALRDYFRACVEKRNANLAFYETTLRRYGLGVPDIQRPNFLTCRMFVCACPREAAKPSLPRTR